MTIETYPTDQNIFPALCFFVLDSGHGENIQQSNTVARSPSHDLSRSPFRQADDCLIVNLMQSTPTINSILGF
jgi:hypothetical protein